MPTKSQIESVWNKARPIRGKDLGRYRQDPYGNPMYRSLYGKSSKMGWEVDHIKPISKGGSSGIKNLQALNTSVNREKGSDQRKRSRHSKPN